jgi:pyruvate dehydrogenase E2 component (dihydrolipoamide acetyltransferase)
MILLRESKESLTVSQQEMDMIELKIPKLGLTMEDAKLLSWQCSSGDEVKKDQTIFIIETDKVTFEVPSPADGIIHPVAKTGETYDVDQTVGYLAENREEYENLLKDYPAEMPIHEGIDETKEEVVKKREETALSPSESKKRIKASPLARSMASSHGLNLAEIRGTGPGGRIIRVDILKALQEAEKAVKEEIPPKSDDKKFIGKQPLETIPIEGIRRVIYDNMYMSLSQTAQLTLHTEAKADALVDFRDRLNKRSGAGETKFSYNAILVKIVATALRMHPKINASVEENEIKVWQQIHIGVAMESEDALLVPVIRNPDFKFLTEINQELNELIIKTRENKLLPDDLANGTFTISNLGFADVDFFTPILRPPESAILGVGRIVRKPGIKNDHIMPEDRMGLSLTFDHRIIDGAPGARFLKTVKEILEDPILMIS